MVDTYDPSHPTARDRLRHSLFDMGTPKSPPSIPPVAFEITGALDPDITYDAEITAFGEDAAKWRMATAFLARYAGQVDSATLDDGTRATWSNRVQAWETIISTWVAQSILTRRASQKPLVGQIKQQGIIASPDGGVDANDQWFRGSPYPRFPW